MLCCHGTANSYKFSRYYQYLSSIYFNVHKCHLNIACGIRPSQFSSTSSPPKREPALKLNVKCFYGREKKIKPWLEYMDHMNLCLYWCIRLFIIFLFIKIIIEHNARKWEYRNTRVENIKSEASPLLELFSVYHHLRALPCHLSFLHLWRWFLPL